MYCKYCGKPIDDDSAFCGFCGNSLKTTENKETVSQPDHHVPPTISSESSCADNMTATVEVVESVPKQKKKARRVFPIIISLVAILLLAAGIMIYTGSNQELSSAELEKLSMSVFKLDVYDEWGNSIATGSAFAALSEQTLITNYHVIDGAYSVKAFAEDGSEFTVDYIAQFDEKADLAILKIAENGPSAPVLPIADTDKVKKGDNVYAIGSPLGLKNTISTGIISGIGEEDGINFFQTTAPISSGSSGGVLVNAAGEVVGITSASYVDGQNLNLAVSASHILKLNSEDAAAITFSDFADASRAHGMEPQNVGMFSNVASSANYIFHSFASDGAITRIDKDTGDEYTFDFGGVYLNVIYNKLYFVDGNSIYCCALDGTDIVEVPFNLKSYKNPQLENLYAVSEGLVFGCYDYNAYMDTFAYYLLPYGSKDPVKLEYMSETASFTETGYYTIEGGYFMLSTFAQPDIASSYFINIDIDPYNAYYSDGLVVYAIDNTIYAFDVLTGQTQIIFTAKSGTIKLRAFYDGYFYFHIKTGNTIPITVDNPLYVMRFGGVPTLLDDYMYPVAMNFANDKLFFTDGTATTPEENRYGYMCNLDGSDLTRIN